ncbi:hypothetical protein QNH39_18815 [Neobacillus novalis]|uniref:HNH domain-containing protein n=1 Tax=Neobacillus novalis TaxID=220687 RepID=A0AA95SB73_9BACI|nr:HNH endonuclease [Neobacillus novalis]WHY84688.1 hypothetical protein QNH39_18815 [Neobacillus novalis]
MIQYIPECFNSKVSVPNVFVEVRNIFKIDSNYLNSIFVESTKEKIIDAKRNSVFLVNIDKELEEILDKLSNELLTNPETNFQYQVEHEDVPEDVTVYDQPKEKPSKTSGNGINSYIRDAKTAKKAIVLAKYKCEIDESHEDFISRVTGKNYIEAHHLIPMEYQNDFTNSIDVEANIVSLCVGCHKKLHHATFTVIEPLIEKLYDDRIKRIRDCDIELTKSKLLSYYK